MRADLSAQRAHLLRVGNTSLISKDDGIPTLTSSGPSDG